MVAVLSLHKRVRAHSDAEGIRKIQTLVLAHLWLHNSADDVLRSLLDCCPQEQMLFSSGREVADEVSGRLN